MHIWKKKRNLKSIFLKSYLLDIYHRWVSFSPKKLNQVNLFIHTQNRHWNGERNCGLRFMLISEMDRNETFSVLHCIADVNERIHGSCFWLPKLPINGWKMNFLKKKWVRIMFFKSIIYLSVVLTLCLGRQRIIFIQIFQSQRGFWFTQ
jgi:hypothetical protein